MFKSVRWRSDKNKITALFKLSFHATQVLQFGGSALVLSVVPADTGKAVAAKLEKTEIRDDCCYWESPIFETVKLIRDPKNGKIHDRIYCFIISTGSSKSTVVGEVSLNISEYFEATKPVSVSLPFNSVNSDAVLHVSIQRIHDNVNKRDHEEHEVARFNPEDRSLKRHFSMGDFEENINTNCNEEKPLSPVRNMAELNGNGRASIGSDITLSGSDNSSGLDTLQELGVKSNDMVSQERAGWEWSLAAAHDSSTDDSTNSQRDALDESVEKLKFDLILLSRKADIADMELQTLRKQIVKESKRGQDLLKEVACLKDERDAFKEECDKLKSSQKIRNKVNYKGDPWALLEETRRELSHEKDLNADLRLQLRKTQESNSELILAVQDLEQLLQQANGRAEERQISDDDDDQKAMEELVKQHSDAKEAYIFEQRIMDLCNEIELYRRDKDELEMQMEQLALDYEILKQENHDMSYKLEQSDLQQQLKMQYECSGSYATIHELENQVEKLERELDNCSNEFSDSLAIIKDLEDHTRSLEDELEKQARRFKAELEALGCAKMEKEQQAIEAKEALGSVRNELENQIKTRESELKKQSKELSDAMATIKELEGHIQNLEEELDKQAQGFESDLEAITRAKVEQEQRAIRSEENLRLTRLKNANTAGRLQDEFRRLSMQMQSTFEANEKMASKAMTEASQLRLMNNQLEELLQEARDELQSVKEEYDAQVSDLRMMLVEIEEKSNKQEVCLSAEVDRLTSETASLRNLQTEMDTLRAQCEELKHSRFKDELEKEKLREQVAQLKAELRKKDDDLSNMERKLKDNNGRAIAAERAKTSSKNSKTDLALRGSKEVFSLKEKIKLLEGQIKQKEVDMETSTNAFLDKEKDLHNKIQELQRKVDEFASVCGEKHDIEALLKEMASLREESSLKGAELKEMQERYSEISLKFAEVEGERQRLVMTLRNVRNTKKS